ncbi:MAG: putative glycoside hydrolase [Syntrophaceae bacterium]
MKKYWIPLTMLWFVLVAASPEPQWTLHTVQPGETLSKIVRLYLPYTAAYTKKELVNSIKSINGIDENLSPGQTIRVPVVWDAPLKPKTVPKAKNYMAKGVYMNPSSAGTRTILDTGYKLRLRGANTVVFDAKDDMGAITYPSNLKAKYFPNEDYTPNIEELPKMIDYLHHMGVHVVARMVVLKDPIMAKINPEWCINREKNWLNPADPNVQEYLLAVVRELSDSGVDEIQLDYIRYFADTKTATGMDGVSRSDTIAGLLKKIHDITAPKGVLLSMDMFGIVIWQRDVDVLVVGQDISKLKPYVDIISPMLYPSHFSKGFSGIKNPADDPYLFVYDGIKRMKDLVGDEVVIRPWLQAFPLHVTKGFGPGYIETQIKAALDAGATGWLLWSPENRYNYSFEAMQNVMNYKPETKVASLGGKGTPQKVSNKPNETDVIEQQPVPATTNGVNPPHVDLQPTVPPEAKQSSLPPLRPVANSKPFFRSIP